MKPFKKAFLLFIPVLFQFHREGAPLYAWTPQDLARREKMCNQAKGLEKSAKDAKETSKNQAIEAEGYRQNWAADKGNLERQIGIFKEKEGEFNTLNAKARGDLIIMETTVQQAESAGRIPQSELYFRPVNGWICRARNCLNSSPPSCQNLPATLAVGCDLSPLLGGEPGNQQVNCLVVNNQACPAGKTVKELHQLITAAIPVKYGAMESLKPGIIRLRTSYLKNLEEWDRLTKASAESLKKSKVDGEASVKLAQEAEKIAGVPCGVKPVDYSKEAERLKKETEELLKIAKGIGQKKENQ